MKIGLYAVRDAVGGTLGMVQAFTNDGVAIRSLEFMAKHGAQQLAVVLDHPGDFTLYCLGTYDDVSGELVSDYRNVCSFVDVLKEEINNG